MITNRIIRRAAAVLAAVALAAGLAATPLAATGHDAAPSIIECWSFFDSDGSSVTVCTDDPVWVDTDGRYFVVTTAAVSPRRVYLPIPAYAPPADAPDRTDAVPLADLPEAQADLADAQPDLPDAPAAVFATLDDVIVEQAEEDRAQAAAAAAACSTPNLRVWQPWWSETIQFFSAPRYDLIAVAGSDAAAAVPDGETFGRWEAFAPPTGGCGGGLYIWQSQGFTADLDFSECHDELCEFRWGNPGSGAPAPEGWEPPDAAGTWIRMNINSDGYYEIPTG